MQIIPVLDIRRGLVVHAQGGNRESYQPIQSVLTSETKPELVIDALLRWYPFPVIYIADLDAIEFGESQLQRYQAICAAFRTTQIWLDIGIKNHQDFQYYNQLNGVSLVVGSETLMDYGWLNQLDNSRKVILSLDCKAGNFLGEKDLLSLPELWPERLLAMQLDNVGSKLGPALDWMEKIQELKPQANVYAAGGVRNRKDLELLRRKGIQGALIATAIHKGVLARDDIVALMEQEHCPSREGQCN